MSASRVTRKVYSAEELHRLRKLQSQPKLREAIERHEGIDADVVKEHVLRGSKSFAARSFRSRMSASSLRAPSTKSNNENFSFGEQNIFRQPVGPTTRASGSVLGEIAPNGQQVRQGPFQLRPSPTPSIKKKKAEAIVKAHGSPTHVRVTAGGRIVPSEQSPLCHPRYGYSAIRTNGGLIKFAPNHHAGNPQWTRATEDGFVAQDVDGNLCQIVNGTILPLTDVDGALRLYMPAPNLRVTQHAQAVPFPGAQLTSADNQPFAAPTVSRVPLTAAEPTAESQINALEIEYSKLEHELKDVDKTEVIHGRTMSRVAKDALIAKRRELVTHLDNIRKALKDLRSRPPQNAPTSPRAMLDHRSMSPPRNRLPAFLQVQQDHSAMSAGTVLTAYGQRFPVAVPECQHGVHPTTPPGDIYASQSWNVPPPSMFAPPFDGTMAVPFAAFPTALPVAPYGGRAPAITNDPEHSIPQDDGNRSSAEQYVVPPRHARAVSIRAPEPSAAVALKSGLNPMSPVYKPATSPPNVLAENNESAPRSINGTAPAPLQSPTRDQQVSTISDEITSSSKRTVHLQSSSISSFDTADFFPRNTREYSTRQDAYASRHNLSDDKENVTPEKEASPVTPAQRKTRKTVVGHGSSGISPQALKPKPLVPPPGTPVHQIEASRRAPLSAQQAFEPPNRETNNVSPKSKREWLFVHEHPGKSSTSEDARISGNTTSVAASPINVIDFSQKPIDWVEGYQAGLQRQAISADRMDKYLEGYCAGLLKSKGLACAQPSTGPTTGNTNKPTSPGHTQVWPSQQVTSTSRPPIEARLESLDNLKQVVFAPQNEDAILTPAIDGPHVSEASRNLGAWAKAHTVVNDDAIAGHAQKNDMPNYFFPQRTTSTLTRPGPVSESEPTYTGGQSFLQSGEVINSSDRAAYQTSLQAFSAKSTAPSSNIPRGASSSDNRVTSMTSIDSSMYRQWPGSRIMTPTEWKSGGSVAHAAGLATGYFANAQFDGTAQMQRVGSVTSASTTAQPFGRFREESLDGITNPPTSPATPISPKISPRRNPHRGGFSRNDSSPGTGTSPTKAKFEHIAGKVGIKVTTSTKNRDAFATQCEPGSPPDKRRWRDIWRKVGKEGAE